MSTPMRPAESAVYSTAARLYNAHKDRLGKDASEALIDIAVYEGRAAGLQAGDFLRSEVAEAATNIGRHSDAALDAAARVYFKSAKVDGSEEAYVDYVKYHIAGRKLSFRR